MKKKRVNHSFNLVDTELIFFIYVCLEEKIYLSPLNINVSRNRILFILSILWLRFLFFEFNNDKISSFKNLNNLKFVNFNLNYEID